MPKDEPAHAMRLLPEQFHPSENDVIFGRGRNVFLHQGNERFRRLIANRLREYSESTTKLEKSYILRSIVAQVRLSSPNGGFVKKDQKTGRWYEVGEFLAREKTSQAFRDALFEQYRSSNTAKKLRRLHDQDISLPGRMVPIGGMFNASMNDIHSFQRSSHPAHLMAHAGATLKKSCPNFGRNDESFDVIAPSLHNYEWNSRAPPKPTDPVGESVTLSARSCRQSSARSVLDFGLYRQESKELSSRFIGVVDYSADVSVSHDHSTAEPVLSRLALHTSDSQQSYSSGNRQCITHGPLEPPGWQTARQEQVMLVNDTFERLLSVVGYVAPDGDPFEPQPMVVSHEPPAHYSGCL